VHVDRLRPHVPFKLQHDIRHSTRTEPDVILPSFPLPPTASPAEPALGSLCLIALPHDDIEPLALGKYLGRNADNEIIVQWYGSNTNIEEPEFRLRRQDWLPGWYQPSDTRFYWKLHRLHSSHVEFTNMFTEHKIHLKEILLSNLKLRPDFRILKNMVDQAIRRWHAWIQLTAHSSSLLPRQIGHK
jgi:hypothetical protein